MTDDLIHQDIFNDSYWQVTGTTDFPSALQAHNIAEKLT